LPVRRRGTVPLAGGRGLESLDPRASVYLPSGISVARRRNGSRPSGRWGQRGDRARPPQRETARELRKREPLEGQGDCQDLIPLPTGTPRGSIASLRAWRFARGTCSPSPGAWRRRARRGAAARPGARRSLPHVSCEISLARARAARFGLLATSPSGPARASRTPPNRTRVLALSPPRGRGSGGTWFYDSGRRSRAASHGSPHTASESARRRRLE